jgi:ribonuclease PH
LWYYPAAMRNDRRPADALRPITIQRSFTRTPAGSVLWTQGQTVVLATASVAEEVPPWFPEDRVGGWVTADYVMLPSSTPQRKPWPKIGHTDSRGTEIQRLIGRTLRAVIDISKIGPRTIAIDCQVLQADGGTRTASICAAYVALSDALATLPRESPAAGYAPGQALLDQLAAVSVGLVEGEIRLDLDYSDDSRADVDLNVAYTGAGRFVEVQGSAENMGADGGGFDRKQFGAMLDLAVSGCKKLMSFQSKSLGSTAPASAE